MRLQNTLAPYLPHMAGWVRVAKFRIPRNKIPMFTIVVLQLVIEKFRKQHTEVIQEGRYEIETKDL